MIFGKLKDLKTYQGLSDIIDRAIIYIMNTNLLEMETGKRNIDGDTITCTIVDHDLEQQPDFWESHQRYIDLHAVVEGSETIRYARMEGEIQKPYNSANDSILYANTIPSFVEMDLKQGDFILLFPGEIHQTNIPGPKEKHVTKAILKILWSGEKR